MKVKVIIENGVVVNVVKNNDEPLDVEIISIDKDYADCKALEAYRDKIYADPSYQEVNFKSADFEGPISKYIEMNGWGTTERCGAMTVDIGFMNQGLEDETEFDINAFDVVELEELFKNFCQENGIDTTAILYVEVVNVARDIDSLP